ncbi:nitrate- and nitrite sensing domain-containing protein [Actinomadura sp. NBRC 104412]|uniref:sensor histidine kinase n=1 Tax=Actinomadura sp. NBRC 104412 TaxID=3032203 RepID=UPI0025532295|nr:nitrate- and nitrite sensing domain-containing protein [Actinomadura sp. NBRC 104412]
MNRRSASIRTWIVVLILVPLLSLAVLWAFATHLTYGDARQLQQSNQFQEKSLLPTQRLIDGLQKERRLSLGRLGGGGPADVAALATQRRATDRARADVERHSRDRRLRGAIERPVVERIDAFVARLKSLEQIRRDVDARSSDRLRVLGDYSGLIDSAFAIYGTVAPADRAIARQGATLVALARAREFLAREDALFSGAAPGGRFTAAERAQFAQLVGAQRMLFADNAAGLPASERERLQRLFASPEAVVLRRLEDLVVRGADPAEPRRDRDVRAPGQVRGGAGAHSAPQVDAAAWRASINIVTERLFQFENDALDALTEEAEGIAFTVVQRLALSGGLGLVAVVVSSVIAVRVSRRLLRESRTLADGVGAFTTKTLPAVAERARTGGTLDPEMLEGGDVPDHDYRIREIRRISESFAKARDAVLVAAARELETRNGISEVFVNLARRNQALLHRQLSLLDAMERRTEDPAELSDLFRLDHLATRMRRHAEGLVILAGKSAGRGWRHPVPVVDVVRGAVAEVEDYARVRVQPLPRKALVGSAVADVIHLLAEIVENATTFSPPRSPVRVSGHAVASGLVIEVEDRGLGMPETDLAAANERLADPPEFDPADSARLGLFVVARLARRHGITVTLRQSPYGGTTAIALIPASLLTDVPEQESPARRTTGQMAAVPERAGARGLASGSPNQTGPVRLVAQPPSPEPSSPEPSAPKLASQPSAPEPSESRPGDAGDRDVPEPARAEREQAPPPPPPPLTTGELPRRRKQTHLAPQLREKVDADLAAAGRAAPAPAEHPVPDPRAEGRDTGGTAGTGGTGGTGHADDASAGPPGSGPRSPEEMKAIMSSMQRGWKRGRSESGQADAGPSLAEEDDNP